MIKNTNTDGYIKWDRKQDNISDWLGAINHLNNHKIYIYLFKCRYMHVYSQDI